MQNMSMSSEEGVLELRRVPSWVADRGYDTEFERNLLIAVHQEDIDEFRDLVEKSEIDFSKYNTAINTCMELCCNRPGYGEFIEILLSARFNPNAIIMHPGITAIHLATINGNYTALEALLAHRRTNVNMISGHGKVAIHYVAERVPVSADDEETVAKCIGVLLSHPDIDVNKCSITDWTLNGNVLHLAARCDNYVVVKALLEDGRIDFNSEDTYGWTALHYAVRHCRNTKDIEDISRNCCLLLLSDPDVDVNKRTSKLTFKIKAVHLAAAVGNDVALEALIKDKRTNVGALDSRKRNALHYVSEQSLQRLEIAKRDKLAIASTVHFSEIDFNSPDFYEWIAMHSAASKGNFAYVIVMLQEDGGTELNSAEINKRLLSRSSNRSFTNEEHEERIRRCISLLIDHPDIDANQYSSMRLIDNVTPLILAAKAGTLANMYSPMLINPKVVPHLAAVTILLSWTQLMFLTGRLPMLSIQLEMLKQRLTKDIESKISDNEKRLQNSIEKNLELIRRNIEAEVGELEVKMKSKLDNARRAEQENKALLHNILQQLKWQGKPS
ncbi:hypothetical protein C0J52_11917 [Blattella germanica]|nr:hypothetical protein C0J52_11917 [Blattella germanica]